MPIAEGTADVMLTLPADLRGLRVHMVGVGGSGMSGLAALLLRRGAHVSGTDAMPSAATDRLQGAGALLLPAGRADSVPADTTLVVRSAAIRLEHAEIQAAHARSIPTVKYAELLGALMARCNGVALAGTHGKSTTSAWLAYALRRAGRDPSFVVGAAVPQLGGGSAAGDGEHFVVEACEFDRSFLNLRPARAAVLNIDEDHLDCYANIDAIEAAFADFARLLPADGPAGRQRRR